MSREEYKPLISVGVTHENYMGGGGPLVDETLTLEAYLIASTLIYWTISAKGLFSWLIDHIKVTFREENKDTIAVFKLTVNPLSNDASYAIKVAWDKKQKTLESPLGENIFHFDARNDCASKDQVIVTIKEILSDFIAHLGKKKTENGRHLEKLSQTIREKI